MKVEFKQYVPSERKIEGKVIDLIGANGSISLIPRNFKDTSKRVTLVLALENGNSTTMNCSKNLSEALRAKKVKVTDLFNYDIIEATAANGETMNTVSMPASALVTIKASEATVSQLASVASFEDLW